MFPGFQELAGNLPGHRPPPRKRSYQRALRRAQRDGGTWYRNQWITSQTYLPEEIAIKLAPATNKRVRSSPRFKILSWNTWSLTQELWREVQDYAEYHHFDILFLQSTCWTFSSSWQTPHYHVVHSGHAKDRHCGVMVMVAKKLCGLQDLSHIIDGRLLHVRVRLPNRGLDLFNVYQHVWRATDSQDTNIANREKIWQSLHTSLTQVPFRNQLLLAGDFNASLLRETHQDDASLRQLVRHHHLGSMLQSRPAQLTFFTIQGNTQIDYLFSRQCQLDAQAKDEDGWVEKECPLGSWRNSLDHRPLIASLPKTWQPWRRKPPALVSAVRLEHLHHMKQHTPEAWSTLCTKIGTEITALTPSLESLETLHQHVMPQLPKTAVPSSRQSGLPSGGLTRQMWECHRALIRPRLTTVHSIFTTWKLWSRIRALRSTLRKQCRQNKRTKLQDQINAAACAFQQRDPYRMYKIINQLAPKAPFRAVHLRSQYGLAQDPAQELAEITTFFRKLCDQSTWQFQAPPLEYLPFTQTDLEHALSCTPKTKSVAPQTSPGRIVAGLAPFLAPWFHQTLTQLWTQSTSLRVPHLWQDAWITCLPKRSVTSPKDLRPIALQCAIGKAILRVIVRKAMQETHHRFVPWPIFAYLKGRSTEQALLRVHRHLRDVRDKCQALTQNIWHRHAHYASPRCHGGITLSLDLSNAFDCVDRSHLAQGPWGGARRWPGVAARELTCLQIPPRSGGCGFGRYPPTVTWMAIILVWESFRMLLALMSPYGTVEGRGRRWAWLSLSGHATEWRLCCLLGLLWRIWAGWTAGGATGFLASGLMVFPGQFWGLMAAGFVDEGSKATGSQWTNFCDSIPLLCACYLHAA